MEDVLEGKSFERLTIQDVSEVRNVLKAALGTRDGTQKSRSTVSHQSSQIKNFLTWLIKQEGFRRLPGDLPGYIKLPKSFYAEAMPREDKAYLKIDEAEDLLCKMPDLSLADKRARAMFAIAFLGALRADTITSLRISHFDPENRKIIQDASLSRTKNGKSLKITWFPIPDCFAAAVLDWVAVLERKGLRGDDALFPNLQVLASKSDLCDPDRSPIAPMTSKDAVSKAFALACRDADTKYSPHSAKHTIAAERDRLRLTQRQRKAWSENMGHENEKITETHYGKMADEERFSLLEEARDGNDPEECLPRDLSVQESIVLGDIVWAAMRRLRSGKGN